MAAMCGPVATCFWQWAPELPSNPKKSSPQPSIAPQFVRTGTHSTPASSSALCSNAAKSSTAFRRARPTGGRSRPYEVGSSRSASPTSSSATSLSIDLLMHCVAWARMAACTSAAAASMEGTGSVPSPSPCAAAACCSAGEGGSGSTSAMQTLSACGNRMMRTGGSKEACNRR